MDHFNALASVAQASHQALLQMCHTVNDIYNRLDTRLNDTWTLQSQMNVQGSVRPLERHLIGKPPMRLVTVSSSQPTSVIKFSQTSKALTAQCSVLNIFTVFFWDAMPAGWEADKKSDTWDDLNSIERKCLQNLLASFPRLVRLMLLHSESFPLVKDNCAKYKQSLKAIGKESEERIWIQLKLGDKSVTMYKVLRHPMIKDLESTLVLPKNTPKGVCILLTN